MASLLDSDNIIDKVRWYVKAHAHSSIGALNLIWTYFEVTGNKKISGFTSGLIDAFESFPRTTDVVNEKKALSVSVDTLHKMISDSDIDKVKKEEMMGLIKGIVNNILLIEKVLENPDYKETFIIKDILFLSLMRLSKVYPDVMDCSFIGEKSQDARVSVAIDVDKEDSQVICCGYDIELLFTNLLSNAIDAIEKDGKITVDMASSDDMLIIRISDDGLMIDGKSLKKMREKKRFSTKAKGHGEGMLIIHDIIDKYKGTFEVNSGDGLTTFKIVLPIVKVKKD